jgi:hypothetical protein
MKNWVKLVDPLGVIHRLQSTEGTSAAHFPAQVLSQAWMSWPSWLRMQGFRPYGIMSLARSTYPFVRGWVTAAQSTWMLLSSQKSRNFLSGELSVILGNDRIRDPKSKNVVLDEIYGLLGAEFGQVLHLDPFSKLINCDE